jgi:hypothetical protein
MPNIDELNERLAQCRRLHDAVLDPTTRDHLTAHAVDLEAQISSAENGAAKTAGENADAADTGSHPDADPESE